jgi:hypothetical protein
MAGRMDGIETTGGRLSRLAFIPKPDRQTARLLVRLAGALFVTLLGFAGFSAYEALVLGLPPLGETPARFGSFDIAKMAFSFAASALIAWTIYSERAVGFRLEKDALSPAARSAAAATIGVAIGSTLLFLIEPKIFAATAQEDQSVEWISTLLLFGGCGLFLEAVLRNFRNLNRVAAALALLLAGLFFVMAMEEISWMQRVVGFATPAEIAQVNWQGEFNFHNVQTDLFENVFYVGSAAFLILVPFVPGRSVAAIAAALSIFNYGMWNVLPQQMTMMLTVFVMFFYARAAARRGDQGEARLFGFLAGAVVAGQAVFLGWGHLQPDIWDASEYKELFIALGFAAYAFEVNRRVRRAATSV